MDPIRPTTPLPRQSSEIAPPGAARPEALEAGLAAAGSIASADDTAPLSARALAAQELRKAAQAMVSAASTQIDAGEPAPDPDAIADQLRSILTRLAEAGALPSLVRLPADAASWRLLLQAGGEADADAASPAGRVPHAAPDEGAPTGGTAGPAAGAQADVEQGSVEKPTLLALIQKTAARLGQAAAGPSVAPGGVAVPVTKPRGETATAAGATATASATTAGLPIPSRISASGALLVAASAEVGIPTAPGAPPTPGATARLSPESAQTLASRIVALAQTVLADGNGGDPPAFIARLKDTPALVRLLDDPELPRTPGDNSRPTGGQAPALPGGRAIASDGAAPRAGNGTSHGAQPAPDAVPAQDGSATPELDPAAAKAIAEWARNGRAGLSAPGTPRAPGLGSPAGDPIQPKPDSGTGGQAAAPQPSPALTGGAAVPSPLAIAQPEPNGREAQQGAQDAAARGAGAQSARARGEDPTSAPKGLTSGVPDRQADERRTGSATELPADKPPAAGAFDAKGRAPELSSLEKPLPESAPRVRGETAPLSEPASRAPDAPVEERRFDPAGMRTDPPRVADPWRDGLDARDPRYAEIPRQWAGVVQFFDSQRETVRQEGRVKPAPIPDPARLLEFRPIEVLDAEGRPAERSWFARREPAREAPVDIELLPA